jgi:hypothetical protein
MRMPSAIVITCLVVALLAGSCRRSETTSEPAPGAAPSVAAPAPLRVRGLDLGSAVGADKRVTAPSSAFAPADTIYVVVATEGGAPGATLTARWTYEDGQLVNEESQVLATPAGAVTEFHIAKPDGWPAGRYRVEIASAGQALGSRDFEVRAAAP